MIGTIVSHYKILEKLGAGGMGVVYKAEDTKLKRIVALKFLPSEMTRDPEAKARFIHEAQAASALQHHNICTIHDIDETPDGQIFIVMDYYQGKTLQEKIKVQISQEGESANRRGLKIKEVIDIVTQIAEGLGKAHEKGIIHRDIKPANILITNDGVVKILDFGLAKLAGQSVLTKTGRTVGTVAYMSPEQAQGDKVDQRTDIWSLGVVMFEMLTGQLPFRSDYEAALLYAIVHEEPPAISSLRSDVSHGLVSIIDKALQKNCNLRYQTMKEFITDLKSGCTSTIELPKQEKSIAVLPFINDSPDEENTYFINGVMEEILNNLQKVKDLRVISRTSVEQYRNQKKTIKEIAKELGVNYIVEGSGQKYGNTFRLRTQLIIAIKESQLWGESFQQEIHDVKDIFRIQSQIAEAIAKELKAAITPQEKQLIEKIPTENFAAYDAYLKGQFYWKKLTPNDLDTAIQYFEMAKEKDPGYALAYAGICDVWIGRQQMGIVPPAEAGPKAFEAAMKALELDSTRAEVHYTLALMKTWGMWDWQGGESAFKKALELNPNHAETHAYYSHFLSMMGQPTEAMGEMEMALKLDPYNPLLKGLYSMSLYMVRRFDEALVAAHDALKMDPTSVVAQSTLGDILFELGRYEEAIENYKLAIKLFGYDEVRYAFDRDYAEAGYRGAFNEVANSLVEISKTRYVLPMIIFTFYLYADNNEKALDWLEKGYEAHDPNLPYLLAFPMYVSVHHEPRFQEIARKMNLPFKN